MEWLQPLDRHEKPIIVAHKLTRALPAFGVLLGLAGLGQASSLFSGVGNAKAITAALLLTLQNIKVSKEGVPEKPQERAIFAGDNLLRIVAILEGGLRLGLLKCSSPRLLELINKLTLAATIASFGLRALKAKRGIEEGRTGEVAAHLIAMSAALVGWTASNRGFAAFGKGLTIIGVGIEIWLIPRKSGPCATEEKANEPPKLGQ